jgi:hypothetical protein
MGAASGKSIRITPDGMAISVYDSSIPNTESIHIFRRCSQSLLPAR